MNQVKGLENIIQVKAWKQVNRIDCRKENPYKGFLAFL